MKLILLALKNLKYRWLSNSLSVLLLSLGIALLIVVQEVNKQAEEKLEKNLAGIDLVIGAKGSPLQLILSSIYHIDAPTGNIPLKQAMKWAQNPLVSEAVPLAFGDSYSGYKILGTNHQYLEWYDAWIKEGEIWKQDLEVVLGFTVAANLGLKIGDQFEGAHGLDAMEDHEAHGHYTVCGILEATGTVLDQLIIGSVGSVWKVHNGAENEVAAKHGESNQEITSLLIKYKTPRAAMLLPRMINENTLLQAAAPAIEINRIYYLLNSGAESIAWIAYGLLSLSLLSLFIQTWLAINTRKQELALLRSFGLMPSKLLILLLFESLLLVSIGFFLGEFLGRGFLFFFAQDLGYGMAYGLNMGSVSSFDLGLLFLCIGMACLAILLQSKRIFTIDIPDLLMSER